MIRFDGKIMLITGGTVGFGLATARLAITLGARVAIAGRREDRGRAAAEALGPDALFVRADVSIERDVQHLVAAVIGRFGHLHVLVNNAGILRRAPVLDEDASHWDLVLGVNLRGVFLCCRYALPHLLTTKGAIVNLASVLAFRTPAGGTPAYDASKAGVVALTRAIAVRYGPDGVRANAVCPGFIPTDMNRDAWETWTGEQREAAVTRVPLRRLGTADDVARATLFLASDAASWITGAALPVDGGVLVSSPR